jgi:hypothetical protein
MPTEPSITPVDHILQCLDSPRRSGRGWVAKCPSHDDRHASLSVAEGTSGKVVIHCFAGCDKDAILANLGLGWHELFPADSRERQRPRLWKGHIPLQRNGHPALQCMGDPVAAVLVGELARLAGPRAHGEPIEALLESGRIAGANDEDLEREIVAGMRAAQA